MDLALTTERLLLTPFSDAEINMAIDMFTDPEVLRYAGGAMSEDDIRGQMNNWTRRGGNGCVGIWCIKDRETAERFGSVALLPMPIESKDTDYTLVEPDTWPDNDIEVGYFLRRSAWGNGYATEGCRRIVRFAFQESPLAEIVATFDTGNAASRRVLEKSGFVNHGTRRCYGEDGVDYRISRDDWLRSRMSR
ncbi:MAG: GNAT family N-acetyltransferase [Woeseiaceae bacterium]|nr:GNAT family N-acetyltransferase [Woeseiaceae bacterium]